jgi:hypothetical protein
MSFENNGIRTILALAVLTGGAVWIAVTAVYGGEFPPIIAHFTNHAHHIQVATKATDVGKSMAETHAVTLRGAMDATITIGDHPGIDISGDKDILSKIRQQSDDDDLTIEAPMDASLLHPIKVTITVTSLDELTVAGGNVVVNGLHGDDLDMTLEGFSSVTANGHLDNATLQVNGAGQLKLDGLEVADIDLKLNGAGKAEVRATDNLDIEINGASDVIYAGSPKHIDKEIHGPGNIREAT